MITEEKLTIAVRIMTPSLYINQNRTVKVKALSKIHEICTITTGHALVNSFKRKISPSLPFQCEHQGVKWRSKLCLGRY